MGWSRSDQGLRIQPLKLLVILLPDTHECDVFTLTPFIIEEPDPGQLFQISLYERIHDFFNAGPTGLIIKIHTECFWTSDGTHA